MLAAVALDVSSKLHRGREAQREPAADGKPRMKRASNSNAAILIMTCPLSYPTASTLSASALLVNT